MRKPITQNFVKVVRTEQWEYTAWLKIGRNVYTATGSSGHGAELNLLRRIVFGTEKHEHIERRTVGE
jgi:hypothetical protein